MRKIIETMLGPSGSVLFLHRGKIISYSKAFELIKKECHPYKVQGNSTVLVAMSLEKYEKIRRDI